MRNTAGRSVGERLRALNPDIILTNYRNGAYTNQFALDEAMEAEREGEAGAGYQVSNERTLELGGQLGEAVDLMRVALGECHSLAAIYAKTPTAAEIYGE